MINLETGLSAESDREQGMRPLNRGVWADNLKNGQELPIGGSLFGRELSTKIELDFEAFNGQLSEFTEENVRTTYEKQSKATVIDWLGRVNSDVDPYIFFVCFNVQQKLAKLLEIDPKEPTDSFERRKMYQGDRPPKLSETKGKTECAERAALGQYLLQRLGLESAYVGGITMEDVKDQDEYPEAHSFIVIKNPQGGEGNETLIFDVARPVNEDNIPRILRTDAPLTYDLLTGREELLVGAKEVLRGGKMWFGVGHPVAGSHEIVGE